MHIPLRPKKATKHWRWLDILLMLYITVLLSTCANPADSAAGNTTGNPATSSPAQAKADATGSAIEETKKIRLAHAQQILKGMTLDEKLGQLIMVEYIGSRDGYDYQYTELPAMISQQHVGGVLYQQANNDFAPPYDTVSGLKGLSDQANKDAKIPLLMAIDQEGGQVTKLSSFFGPVPSAAQMAQSGDPNSVLAQGKQNAQWMAQVGINVDLAPVVDVGPVTHLLEDRQFSDNPQTVATYAGAFLDGLQQNGTIGCIKHFPGLGTLPDDKANDPHGHLPVDDSSMADLEATNLAPYKQLIQKDNPAMIMTTDIITKAIDPDLPAEFSPKAINILRQEMKYDGVIITDGLYMVDNFWSLSDAAVMAISAGNDMVEGPYTADQVAGVVTALKTALQAGTIKQEQIDQSVQRILMLKIQYGIIK
ncbi:MAG TPA: glycoside hydrolase family 3 N-terminal domain-containing protein [Ktedonobacteraceae bacterium]|nr:glycoside hydrolase family 3 N-terminal domain-containing protein [Ktedonobacteraceae bacterium]